MTTEIHATQTKLVESTLGTRERDFYIDCLRSVIIALVVCITRRSHTELRVVGSITNCLLLVHPPV
jgi:hypothetical protein